MQRTSVATPELSGNGGRESVFDNGCCRVADEHGPVTVIDGFCLEWHVLKSPAFRDLLVDPLTPHADVRLRAWDGVSSLTGMSERRARGPVVFCQLPPPPELLQDPRARLVWLPMWDYSRRRSQGWWDRLPKHLRVVAFSDAVAERAESAGLPTLRLRYYKDPAQFQPVRWDAGRILLYWNRIGLVGPRFLERLCAALRIEKLLFRGQADPGAPQQARYDLPPRLGETVVEELPGSLSHEEYLRATSQANTFLAPRPYEGVGMTSLEAMARGCAVLAYDAPAANEYITHGRDGYLFQPPNGSLFSSGTVRKGVRRLWRMGLGFRTSLGYHLPECQDWEAIGEIDLGKLGQNARNRQRVGFSRWQSQIDAYARFVLEW